MAQAGQTTGKTTGQNGQKAQDGQTEQHFFKDPVQDRLMAVCMTLANEVWVTRSRLMTLETLLAEKQLVNPDELVTSGPSEDQQAALDNFADALVAALNDRQASRGAETDILKKFS